MVTDETENEIIKFYPESYPGKFHYCLIIIIVFL